MNYKREEGTSPESVCLYPETAKEVVLQKQAVKAGEVAGVDTESG